MTNKMIGPLKVFAGRSHPCLVDKICEILDIPRGLSKTIKFSNENLMVQLEENVRGCDVFYLQTMAPPVNENIMEMLIAIDALKHASAGRITAVLPSYPYARSDKKDKPRISITARLMADMLQTAGADRVITMDLHAPQIQGFFHIPVDHLYAVPTMARFLQDNIGDMTNCVLVAGDAGEAKEVGRYTNRLHLPMAIVDKRREDDSEKAKATHIVGDVKGKCAIIIDDECATGGTLIEASVFLLESGASSVRAAFTHPVLANDAVAKLEASPIEEFFFCDTIPLHGKESKKFRQVSIADIFAKAIRRTHTGDSLSALFD